MGMYDTFYFKSPLYCPFCGTGHKDTQSKNFENDLREFKPGQKIPNLGKYPNRISREEMCCPCDDGEERYGFSDYPWFYVVIKDGVYLDAYPSKELAETNFNSETEYYYDT